MKLTLFIIALFSSINLFAQNTISSKKNGTLTYEMMSYGIMNAVEGTVEKSKTPTGTHGWLADLGLQKETDSIPIKPKQNFGIIYIVKAKDTTDIEIDIEWIYPAKIVNEQGESFKSIRYPTKRPTNTPSGSSYSLDAPYEMVKGKWTINIYVENKKVGTKSFIVY